MVKNYGQDLKPNLAESFCPKDVLNNLRKRKREMFDEERNLCTCVRVWGHACICECVHVRVLLSVCGCGWVWVRKEEKKEKTPIHVRKK